MQPIDRRLDPLVPGGREVQEDAVDAGVRQPLDHRGIEIGAEEGDLGSRLARLLGAAAQLGDARLERPLAVRHPVVAIAEHAVEHLLAVAADVDRQRVLEGLR
jgi:hypothetical protein